MISKPHLFPHAYIPEPVAGKLVLFFGPARIYLPWLLNPPRYIQNAGIEVIYPPEDLKPSGDFKAILSNYHSWAGENRDRSIRETAKFSGKVTQDDNPAWEIRRLLKGTAMPARALKGEDQALKRHLLLHLAFDMERQQFEIMDMIDRLKKQKPVLAGALHEAGEAEGVFADADDITAAVALENLNLPALLDAWFGLFSGYLKEKDLLVTYSRPVMDYILSQWDENSGEENAGNIRQISFSLPDLPSNADITKIRDLILRFGDEPDYCMNELLLLTKKIEGSLPKDPSKETIKIQLRKFSSTHGEGSVESDDLLRNIAGKCIILMTGL